MVKGIFKLCCAVSSALCGLENVLCSPLDLWSREI